MVLRAHLDEVAAVFDDRRDPRRALQLETSGVMPGGAQANVTVHNLSAAGMLLETDLPLETGEVLAIDLPDLGPIDAKIVWQSEHLYGCAFAEALPADAVDFAQAEAFPPVGMPARSTRRLQETFGARLNRLRRERRLTLAQVAEQLEVSKPTVWAWEKGKARPLPERIDAIADALGVSIAELSETRSDDEGRGVIEECRLRIATSYGTSPDSIRIMVEI